MTRPTVKAIREKLKLTQKQLAERLDISLRTVARMEAGKPANRLIWRALDQLEWEMDAADVEEAE